MAFAEENAPKFLKSYILGVKRLFRDLRLIFLSHMENSHFWPIQSRSKMLGVGGGGGGGGERNGGKGERKQKLTTETTRMGFVM